MNWELKGLRGGGGVQAGIRSWLPAVVRSPSFSSSAAGGQLHPLRAPWELGARSAERLRLSAGGAQSAGAWQ